MHANSSTGPKPEIAGAAAPARGRWQSLATPGKKGRAPRRSRGAARRVRENRKEPYFAAARAAWISASFALSARGMRGAWASSSVESFEGFFSYSA